MGGIGVLDPEQVEELRNILVKMKERVAKNKRLLTEREEAARLVCRRDL